MVFDTNLPSYFDVVLTDVQEQDLRGKIANDLKMTYLEDTKNRSQEILDGIIWGIHRRIMLPLIMEFSSKRKNVIFLVEPASPKTYVDSHVFMAFGKEVFNPVPVFLNGHEILVEIIDSKSPFAGKNLLGADFLALVKGILCVDYEKCVVKLSGNFKYE